MTERGEMKDQLEMAPSTNSEKCTDLDRATDRVQNMIKENKIVIFSKTYCSYCIMAKNVFKNLKQKYKAYELNKRKDGEEIQKVLKNITGSAMVPCIFINGKYIGGGTKMYEMSQQGYLQILLGIN